MKKVMKGTLAVLIVVSLLLGMASCGGNDPKSLAEQVAGSTKELINLAAEEGVDDDDPKLAALIKKLETLNQKVEKLSESDKEIFDEELKKLW